MLKDEIDQPTPQGDPVAKWMNAFADMAADRDRHAGALRRLVLMARTSGGVAGHDDALCAACDEAETVLTGTRTATDNGKHYDDCDHPDCIWEGM